MVLFVVHRISAQINRFYLSVMASYIFIIIRPELFAMLVDVPFKCQAVSPQTRRNRSV